MKPKLRRLEAHPIQHEGDELFLLRDPHGHAPDAVVPRSFGALLALFDGTRDAAQIMRDFGDEHDFEIGEEFVAHFIAEADENLLLDSPRFQSHLAQERREYSQRSSRAAAFAGRSYPENPQQLSALLNQLSQRGAALLAAKNSDASTRESQPRETRKALRGIVVPHIDFTRGGAVEAMAYDALRGETFDTLIVFGIAHCGVNYPFCATTKDYETPLGNCETDREFLKELQNEIGEKLTREAIAHRDEHSIEFVATFLQHHENLKTAKIAPILCGGFFQELRDGTSPSLNIEVAQFCAKLREIVCERKARGEKIGFIASVDLSHVGTQFGDARVLAREDLQSIEHADRAFLRCAENGDAEALHAELSRDNNARNVDAHPALYALLHAFPELRAQLLHYDQAFDAAQNIVVSFAAMTLFEEN